MELQRMELQRMEDDEFVPPAEKYQLYLWMQGGPAKWRYYEERWFVERPTDETITLLMDEAKRTFAALYPDTEPSDFSAGVTRLRPADDYRPSFERVID